MFPADRGLLVFAPAEWMSGRPWLVGRSWFLVASGRGPVLSRVFPFDFCDGFKQPRFKGTDPRTGMFLVRYPQRRMKPDGVLTLSIFGKHYVCYCCSGTSVDPEASRRRYLGQRVQVDVSDFGALLRGSHRPSFFVTAQQCDSRDQYSQPFSGNCLRLWVAGTHFGVTAFQPRSIGKDIARDFGWLYLDSKGQATIEYSSARDVLFYMIRAECCPVAPCRFARLAAVETAVSVTTSTSSFRST